MILQWNGAVRNRELFPEAQHSLPSATACREKLWKSHASIKTHPEEAWPQILGSRQVNQGERSPAPVQGTEGWTEENISIRIGLGLLLATNSVNRTNSVQSRGTSFSGAHLIWVLAFYPRKMACASEGGHSFLLTTGIATTSSADLSTMHKSSVRPHNSMGCAQNVL